MQMNFEFDSVSVVAADKEKSLLCQYLNRL
jgi:hypothetical protein